MIAAIFHCALGLLFVVGAVHRAYVLHKNLPITAPTPTLFRQAMHVEMVVGICLLAFEIF